MQLGGPEVEVSGEEIPSGEKGWREGWDIGVMSLTQEQKGHFEGLCSPCERTQWHFQGVEVLDQNS